ncbi:10310_t:CDS:10 [Racocetra fulgida]|uniref:10310_t:CDS:1 n=1 Tax=Racocetra fulgida TaxID=60492 RepID=A0A9N8W6V7_9GLOM|nr:10310_t:CDS:10 [Racocetra fulgida]
MQTRFFAGLLYYGVPEDFFDRFPTEIATKFQELKRKEDLFQKLYPNIKLKVEKLITLKSTDKTIGNTIKDRFQDKSVDRTVDKENQRQEGERVTSKETPIKTVDMIGGEYGTHDSKVITELKNTRKIRPNLDHGTDKLTERDKDRDKGTQRDNTTRLSTKEEQPQFIQQMAKIIDQCMSLEIPIAEYSSRGKRIMGIEEETLESEEEKRRKKQKDEFKKLTLDEYQSLKERGEPVEDTLVLENLVRRYNETKRLASRSSTTKENREKGMKGLILAFTEEIIWSDLENFDKVMNGITGFTEFKAELRNRTEVAHYYRSIGKKMPQTFYCLVGKAGVGKTEISKTLAKAYKRPLVIIGMAGQNHTKVLKGMRPTLDNASYGRVTEALCEQTWAVFRTKKEWQELLNKLKNKAKPTNNQQERMKYIESEIKAIEEQEKDRDRLQTALNAINQYGSKKEQIMYLNLKERIGRLSGKVYALPSQASIILLDEFEKVKEETVMFVERLEILKNRRDAFVREYFPSSIRGTESINDIEIKYDEDEYNKRYEPNNFTPDQQLIRERINDNFLKMCITEEFGVRGGIMNLVTVFDFLITFKVRGLFNQAPYLDQVAEKEYVTNPSGEGTLNLTYEINGTNYLLPLTQKRDVEEVKDKNGRVTGYEKPGYKKDWKPELVETPEEESEQKERVAINYEQSDYRGIEISKVRTHDLLNDEGVAEELKIDLASTDFKVYFLKNFLKRRVKEERLEQEIRSRYQNVIAEEDCQNEIPVGKHYELYRGNDKTGDYCFPCWGKEKSKYEPLIEQGLLKKKDGNYHGTKDPKNEGIPVREGDNEPEDKSDLERRYCEKCDKWLNHPASYDKHSYYNGGFAENFSVTDSRQTLHCSYCAKRVRITGEKEPKTNMERMLAFHNTANKVNHDCEAECYECGIKFKPTDATVDLLLDKRGRPYCINCQIKKLEEGDFMSDSDNNNNGENGNQNGNQTSQANQTFLPTLIQIQQYFTANNINSITQQADGSLLISFKQTSTNSSPPQTISNEELTDENNAGMDNEQRTIKQDNKSDKMPWISWGGIIVFVGILITIILMKKQNNFNLYSGDIITINNNNPLLVEVDDAENQTIKLRNNKDEKYLSKKFFSISRKSLDFSTDFEDALIFTVKQNSNGEISLQTNDSKYLKSEGKNFRLSSKERLLALTKQQNTENIEEIEIINLYKEKEEKSSDEEVLISCKSYDNKTDNPLEYTFSFTESIQEAHNFTWSDDFTVGVSAKLSCSSIVGAEISGQFQAKSAKKVKLFTPYTAKVKRVIGGKSYDYLIDGKYSGDNYSESRCLTEEITVRNILLENYYCVIDNIGFGDAVVEEKEVLIRIGEAINSAYQGLSHVLFIFGGRFSDKEKENFRKLAALKITNSYITLVRSKFNNFGNKRACERDKAALENESPEIEQLLNNCRGLLHINNGDEDSRDKSRKKVLEDISSLIEDYFKEKEKLENKIKVNVEQKKAIEQQIDDLKTETANQIKEKAKGEEILQGLIEVTKLKKSESGRNFEHCLNDINTAAANYTELITKIANNVSSPASGTFCCDNSGSYRDADSYINKSITCSPLIADHNYSFTNYCPHNYENTTFGRCTKIDQSYFCVTYDPFFSVLGDNSITTNITTGTGSDYFLDYLARCLTEITSSFSTMCCDGGDCSVRDLRDVKYGRALSTDVACFSNFCSFMCFQDNDGYIANGTYNANSGWKNYPTSFSKFTFIGDLNLQIKLPPKTNSSPSNPNLPQILIPVGVGTGVTVIVIGGVTYYYCVKGEKKQQTDENITLLNNPFLNDNQNNIKNILLIGSTGKGKSTLANVITGLENKFKESDVIDTVGIGDTKLKREEVLDKIAEAVYLVKDGVSQVFFVIGNKFDQREMENYDLLRTIIFDNEIVNHTTIVRNCFENFKEPEECKKDIDSMIKEGGKLAGIIESRQEKAIRQEVLKHIFNNCDEIKETSGGDDFITKTLGDNINTDD